MKIFVTGGAGFIGSNFIRHVLGLRQGYAIVNFDKLTYAGNLANLESVSTDPQYSFVRGDICDTAAVETAMGASAAVPCRDGVKGVVAGIARFVRRY